MNELILYSSVISLLFVSELFYFKIAERFSIIDKPNQRSSHIRPTIRGGGVIFILALIMWFVFNDFSYPCFFAGALLLAIISFADDLGERPALFRFTFQLISFLLMGYQVGLFEQPVWLIPIIVIIGIGIINAFNFMDGINGITGIYGMINLITFYVINNYIISFADNTLIIFIILGILVFLFFNLRRVARCFAGDVGSTFLAFIQLFLLLKLILSTAEYEWILLFSVYAVDSIITIIYRLLNKENIFQSHRSHVYQYLANELGFSHILISVLYGLIQLGINIFLIVILMHVSVWFMIGFAILGICLYLYVREILLKKIGIKGLLLK